MNYQKASIYGKQNSDEISLNYHIDQEMSHPVISHQSIQSSLIYYMALEAIGRGFQ